MRVRQFEALTTPAPADTLCAMADYETRRFSRIEYDKLIDLGVFRPGEPIELLGGHLVVAEPQGVWIVNLVDRVLEVP